MHPREGQSKLCISIIEKLRNHTIIKSKIWFIIIFRRKDHCRDVFCKSGLPRKIFVSGYTQPEIACMKYDMHTRI